MGKWSGWRSWIRRSGWSGPSGKMSKMIWVTELAGVVNDIGLVRIASGGWFG